MVGQQGQQNNLNRAPLLLRGVGACDKRGGRTRRHVSRDEKALAYTQVSSPTPTQQGRGDLTASPVEPNGDGVNGGELARLSARSDGPLCDEYICTLHTHSQAWRGSISSSPGEEGGGGESTHVGTLLQALRTLALALAHVDLVDRDGVGVDAALGIRNLRGVRLLCTRGNKSPRTGLQVCGGCSDTPAPPLWDAA